MASSDSNPEPRPHRTRRPPSAGSEMSATQRIGSARAARPRVGRRQALRKTVRMSSSRKVLLAATLLVAAGLALVLVDTDAYQGYSIGDVGASAAYSSELSIGFDGAWLVSTQALIGYALMWSGTLLIAGVGGFRLASRRSSSS